jgi:uncharacterized protein DUF5343
MPTLPTRAAAYTRTGILRKFLDQLSDAPPARVDNAYAEQKMGLKGGDVRAFLQSLRVLGLIDPYGMLTDRGKRTRAGGQRPAAMREALEEAYPELIQRWERQGHMSREEIEDFFKVEYGLSSSSAGPAAKLFQDLMWQYTRPEVPRSEAEGSGFRVQEQKAEGRRQEAGGSEEAGFPNPQSGAPSGHRNPPLAQQSSAVRSPFIPHPSEADVRVAALEAIKSSLRVEITADWDEEKISLVFDRMERLVDRILEKG